MLLALETTVTSQEKVSIILRCVAKAVDSCVIFFFSIILPYPVGVLLGFIYTLVHDGLAGGRSLGKRICKLQVINTKENRPASIRDSVIRNAPLGVATFFGIIPFWGWILLVLVGIPLVILEIYLMKTQETGGRLGDVMADTKVIDISKKKK